MRDLSQSLQRGLFVGLHQGPAPTRNSLKHTETALIGVPSDASAPQAGFPTSGASVRQISLLPGESISHTFSPENGLIPEPVDQGRMLVLTDRRVMTFGQKDGIRETVLMPLEEVKAVQVNAGHRSKGTLFQGGLMIIAAVVFYVLLAYWLTGRIDGPTVPVIRMDLVAFVVFLAILTGVTLLAQMYFAKPGGAVTFQGDGVKFTFPFRGETAEGEIYVLVNAAFAARQTIVGDIAAGGAGVGYSGLGAG